MAQPPKIYGAITAAMNDINAVGKGKKNAQQGFMYRGVDDVMNAINPALSKHGIFIVPEVTDERRSERQTGKGGTLFSVRLDVNFRFYAADGSYITARVIGEAMDSGDKATNKAMSIAYKYACFQVFCIPTEDMQDPDAEVHEVKPAAKAANPEKPQPQPKPKAEEPMDDEAQLGMELAIEEAKRSQSVESLQGVWNKYQLLYGKTAFKDAVVVRKKELMAK